MKKLLPKIIGGLILALFFFLGARAYYFAALERPAPGSEPQKITISRGMGLDEIGNLLFEKELINSRTLFKLYLALNHLQSTLEAGEYTIPPHLNLKETVKLLQHGTFDIKLTFPEGWRREEMAAYIDKQEGVRFRGLDFLRESEGMEGYLFPETYFVSPETAASDLVARMREMFDRKFSKDLRKEAERRGLTESEVVILASIVEREAKFAADRPKVAGILIKRWRSGWPLEADATTQYAVANLQREKCLAGNLADCGWWPRGLSSEELQLDSPYNTRKYKGLPPAPICNPGLETIEAVVNYEDSPYWFYVSDREGRIHFSKTLDEHQRKVLKYTAS